MSDAAKIAIMRRQGVGGLMSPSDLDRALTLAENYLFLRDETSHLEFFRRGGVSHYKGDGHSLDEVIALARKGESDA